MKKVLSIVLALAMTMSLSLIHILVEAETDKAILPVESYAAGVVLDVLVAEGDDVHAGDVLVAVGSEEDRKSYVRSGRCV